MKYLYRIVNILLALSTFPVAIFADLIAFRMSTSFISEVGLEESISIKFIIDVITGKEAFWHEMIFEKSTSSFGWPAALDPIKGRLIAVAVCFVLVLVAMLFIIFWSIFSSRRIPVLAATVTALISTIVMIACFNSAAALIVDGSVNIMSVFSGGWLMGIVGNFVGFDSLILGGFQNGIIFILVGLLVWTGSYYLIEIGEPEEEKAKGRK